jgi:hypothetical protein
VIPKYLAASIRGQILDGEGILPIENKHVYAPHDTMVREMNKREGNTGDVMEELLRRHIFNWLPGGTLTWKRLQVVQW